MGYARQVPVGFKRERRIVGQAHPSRCVGGPASRSTRTSNFTHRQGPESGPETDGSQPRLTTRQAKAAPDRQQIHDPVAPHAGRIGQGLGQLRGTSPLRPRWRVEQDARPMAEALFTTRTRFSVEGFSIAAELIGESLTFVDEGVLTKLILPPIEAVGDSPFDHAPASSSAKRRNGEKLEPIDYRIHAVDVELFPEDSFDFAADPYTQAERTRTSEISRPLAYRSEGALSTFFQVARWQARSPRIGRPTKMKADAGITLLARSDGRTLYVDGPTLYTEVAGWLTVLQWEAIGRALQDGARPPVYWDLFLEGEWLLHTGDLRRASLDMAMACEIFIQTKVSRSLPTQLAGSVRRFVEKANAGTQRDKLFAEALTPAQQLVWKDLKKHIKAIAERRNHVVHQGAATDLSHSQLRKEAEHIRTLLDFD